MGLLDDFFDTKITDNKSKIKYTPMKMPDIKLPMKKNAKKIENNIRSKREHDSALKKCIDVVYINSIEWCIALKGTHIHKKCMEEIFNNLSSRKGIQYCDFADTLCPSWSDYWYDVKNHRHYTKVQLKRVEREFDKGKESEDLVLEMLRWVWFSMIPKNMMYEEIDDLGIYKLSVKYIK